MVTTAIEHPAVSKPFAALEEMGWEVTYLPVDEKGYVSTDDIKKFDIVIKKQVYLNVNLLIKSK